MHFKIDQSFAEMRRGILVQIIVYVQQLLKQQNVTQKIAPVVFPQLNQE